MSQLKMFQAWEGMGNLVNWLTLSSHICFDINYDSASN